MRKPYRLYLVGGAVRDLLMLQPRRPTDYDFAVEAASYGIMRANLEADGLEIWKEYPEFVTMRGGMPAGKFGGSFRGLVDVNKPDLLLSADFVLCRKDGVYTDSARPDSVEVGTLDDDLARRDFTINAMAMTPDGEVIDPHMGMYDLRHGLVRAVGNPNERINEDPIRIVRALRFAAALNFSIDYSLSAAMEAHAERLTQVEPQRIANELYKMFSANTDVALDKLYHYRAVRDVLFRNSYRPVPGWLWLMPTLRGKA